MTSDEFCEIQKTLGYTNEKMSKALGVSVSAVEKWRYGNKTITTQTARMLKFILYFHDRMGMDPIDGMLELKDLKPVKN